jgi:hypothetical protein
MPRRRIDLKIGAQVDDSRRRGAVPDHMADRARVAGARGDLLRSMAREARSGRAASRSWRVFTSVIVADSLPDRRASLGRLAREVAGPVGSW